LSKFFDDLGSDRSAAITHVSADQAQWIADVVDTRCPNAVRCADPFHIVMWATKALDEVRRRGWNTAHKAAASDGPRGRGRPAFDNPVHPQKAVAKKTKGTKFALLKNPENLSERQRETLAWVEQSNPELHRAYRLKEGLRLVFTLPIDQASEALDRWISWARRCRIPEFVKLQKSILTHRASILASITHNLSNGRIESMKTKIRLIARIAFGFKSAEALIAMAMLSLGGHKPALPGRQTAHWCVTRAQNLPHQPSWANR